LNVELANQALELAGKHPERFDMEDWYRGPQHVISGPESRVAPCGTTACYAGWVAILTVPDGTVIKDAGLYDTAGDTIGTTVEAWACDQLDISYEQGQALFYLDDLPQVEKAVKYLADNPDASNESIWREAGHFGESLLWRISGAAASAGGLLTMTATASRFTPRPISTAARLTARRYIRLPPKFDVEAAFREEFVKAVGNEYERGGVDPDEWFAAGRGNGEGEEWWLANGGRLAQNFITWYESRPDVNIWIAPDGRPAIELGLMVMFGKVPVKMYIDLVLAVGYENPALVVTDLKSGSRRPDNPRQLAIYANAIEQFYGIRPRYGAYFMNRGTERRGELSYFQQPIEMDQPQFDYGYLSHEFEMFDLAVTSGIFPAKPGEQCRRCGVAYACTEVGGQMASVLDPNYPRASMERAG
jgi:putative RecB family exonuclease